MTNDTNDLEQQNKRERDRLLHSIFTRTAKAIDDILKNTDPADLKASMLQSINTFLRINDISNETIPDEDEDQRETRELAAQVQRLMKEGEEQARKDAEILAAGGTIQKRPSPQSESFDDNA